jgi:hypothetical protein
MCHVVSAPEISRNYQKKDEGFDWMQWVAVGLNFLFVALIKKISCISPVNEGDYSEDYSTLHPLDSRIETVHGESKPNVMAIIIAVHHNPIDYVGIRVLALLEAEEAFHCLATTRILAYPNIQDLRR